MREYWEATRHPWACVLFVLPLLVLYEVGLFLCGPTAPEHLRNGADVWLRLGLAAAGVSPLYGAPLFLLLALLGWALIYRGPAPRDWFGAWAGMLVESALFAACLYGLSVGLWPLLHVLPAVSLEHASTTEPALQYIVRYLGAGIYEETVFRLLLFSGLFAFLNCLALPERWALVLAAVASALLFAAAHNLGPHGEPFHPYIFLFRTIAGLFFAWLFCVRGFGIAVGAHTGYDVLVGVLLG